MGLIERIVDFGDELVAIRQDIHAHPEIGFEEVRTSGLVAEKLASWGVEVHRGLGKTGVVGVIHGRGAGPTVGLRADMDALPILEATGVPYASKTSGVAHSCGHDGHTAMLLGAARYLAETRDFDGTVVAIFQPAEEGLGGARAMIADGLFERFPCQEVYGLHNAPNGRHGQVTALAGPAMAAADSFDIDIRGRGSHGASPHHAVDTVMVAVAIAQAMQTIVSRNVDPIHTAVVSVTQIHAGAAYNVIPETARLSGTLRSFDDAVRALIRTRLRALAEGIAASYGATATVDIRDVFSVLRNAPAQTEAAAQIARELVGPDQVSTVSSPRTGSEDFADMLMKVPGAYVWLGQKSGPNLHNPAYDFDDTILPIGASLLARIAERRVAALANG
jgi:hippurate hydrolase